jgi:glutathione synthase/RimK-type ligase-like ATP-grasp enzyme
MDSSASTTFATGIVVTISEANLAQMTEAALQDGYAIVQEFVDGGEDGDPRIFLLEGWIVEQPRQAGCLPASAHDAKTVYARQMDVYATLVESPDHEVGRLVDAIENLGELDNTLLIYISGDNGGS